VKQKEAEPTAVTAWNEASAPVQVDAGTAVAIAQIGDEIKAAVVTAKHFPRDENVSFTKIMKSCERASFAERAAYLYKRGGTDITGPSVHLAREQARCWGNMRSGIRIVAVTEDEIHIAGWAFDAENNNYSEGQDRFKKLIQRKSSSGTRWIEADERELRELINRRGAICERNALLKILPPDITEIALQRARETLHKAANGELEQNREDAIRRLVLAFDRLAVTSVMLELYLNHPLKVITADEIARLREVYRSIEDGNSTREEHFEVTPALTGPASPLNTKVQEAH